MANRRHRDSLTKLPVHVTVGLAFAAAKWENMVIFKDIVERMAIKCPSTLSGWEEGPHKKDKGIVHSVSWECELLTAAQNFDLDMFLPSLYLRIIGELTVVSARRYGLAHANGHCAGICRGKRGFSGSKVQGRTGMVGQGHVTMWRMQVALKLRGCSHQSVDAGIVSVERVGGFGTLG